MTHVSQFYLMLSMAILGSALSLAQAAPVLSHAALPTEVRAETPTGIVSVALFQLAPAPGAAPLLFHLWTAPRRDPEGGGTFGVPAGAYHGPIGPQETRDGGLRVCPFVLDVFSRSSKSEPWFYQASVITRATKAPTNYTLRYLDAKQKSGYVVTTQSGAGHWQEISVHVFPDSAFERLPISRVFEGHFYMDSTFYSFPRDENGVLQVMRHETNFVPGVGNTLEKRTTLAWDWNSDGSADSEMGWKMRGEAVTLPLHVPQPGTEAR